MLSESTSLLPEGESSILLLAQHRSAAELPDGRVVPNVLAVPRNEEACQLFLNDAIELEVIPSFLMDELFKVLLSTSSDAKHFEEKANIPLVAALWFRLVDNSLGLNGQQQQDITKEQNKVRQDVKKSFEEGSALLPSLLKLSAKSTGGATKLSDNSAFVQRVEGDLQAVVENSIDCSVLNNREITARREMLLRLMALFDLNGFLDNAAQFFLNNSSRCARAMSHLTLLIQTNPETFFTKLFLILQKNIFQRQTLDWVFDNIVGLRDFTFVPTVSAEKERYLYGIISSSMKILNKGPTFNVDLGMGELSRARGQIEKYAAAENPPSLVYSRDSLESSFSNMLQMLLTFEQFYLIRLVVSANRQNVDRPLYHYIRSLSSQQFENPSLLNINWLIVLSGQLEFLENGFYKGFSDELRDALEACLIARLQLHDVFYMHILPVFPQNAEETNQHYLLVDPDSSSYEEKSNVEAEAPEQELDGHQWSADYQEALEVSLALSKEYPKRPYAKNQVACKQALTRLFADYYLEPLYFYAQNWREHTALLANISRLIDQLDESSLAELSRDWRFVFFLLMRFSRSARSSEEIPVADIGKVDQSRYFCEQLAYQIKDFISNNSSVIEQSWIHFLFTLDRAHYLADTRELKDIGLGMYLEGNKKDPLVEFVSCLLQDRSVRKILNYLSDEYLDRIFQRSGIEIDLVKNTLKGNRLSGLVRKDEVVLEDCRQEAQRLMGVDTSQDSSWSTLLGDALTIKSYSHFFKQELELRKRLYEFLKERNLLSRCNGDHDFVRFLLSYCCFYYADKAMVAVFSFVVSVDKAEFKKAIFFYRLLENFDQLASKNGFLTEIYGDMCTFFDESFLGIKSVHDFWKDISTSEPGSAVIALLSPEEKEGLLGKQRTLYSIGSGSYLDDSPTLYPHRKMSADGDGSLKPSTP